MENKKTDVNSLEELSKAADALQKCIVVFGNELSRALDDIKALKKEEDTWEMKCPYEVGDVYYIITTSGLVNYYSWNNDSFENMDFKQGNIFPTKEAAELEAKRRNLLTRFRAFRNECNGGWNPDWKDGFEDKLFISFDIFGDKLSWRLARSVNGFNTFGYFQNESDALKAIELFGDEIKELFVECD